MITIPNEEQIDLARSAGYTVTQSVWDAGGGKVGLTWMTFTPDGDRFDDDYPDAGEAWRAAAHHLATGKEARAGELASAGTMTAGVGKDGASAGNMIATSSPEKPRDGAIIASIRIDVEVKSVEALYRAAFREYATANGYRRAEDLGPEFEEMYGAPERPDILSLTRLLFDSGRTMAGVSVQNSYATIHSAPTLPTN